MIKRLDLTTIVDFKSGTLLGVPESTVLLVIMQFLKKQAVRNKLTKIKIILMLEPVFVRFVKRRKRRCGRGFVRVLRGTTGCVV